MCLDFLARVMMLIKLSAMVMVITMMVMIMTMVVMMRMMKRLLQISVFGLLGLSAPSRQRRASMDSGWCSSNTGISIDTGIFN